jgi:universal stress protein F
VKRILVALDASARAPGVLRAAMTLAELAGAKLVLFRAIGVTPELPRDVLALTDTRLDEFLERNARADLERMAAGAKPKLIERFATMFATSWDGICRAGREYDADLIVIGSHGYSGIDHVIGTTAAKVVNRADRNVLVVRTPL